MSPARPLRSVSPGRALLFPLGAAVVLACYALAPGVRVNATLTASFVGAAALLAIWAGALWARTRATGRQLVMGFVARKPHYVQACAQGTLLLWWGWHVRSVYAFVPFILGQLVFSYGVESLLNWTRRGEHAFGFGPIPITLSINFFLWFKADWFYWQFAMILVGYAAKEFIRWQKDGRSAHVFNPSSFPLAVASLVLIATASTDVTFGLEIASTLFNPPHIYLVIFLVSLPGQILFGVTTMTIAAALTTYAFSLAYFALTGTYFFHDAFIPVAVFLGMHLLFTDPSTSPRTELGRVLFGVLYASFILGLVVVLRAIGAPTFYDKLLPIPILNTMVRRIDAFAIAALDRLPRTLRLDELVGATGRRLGTVGVWVLAFLALSGTGGVGDEHPGQYLPFWEQACEAGSDRGCEHYGRTLEVYCDRGSGWACNEFGILLAERRDQPEIALIALRRGCLFEFQAACANTERLATAGPLLEAPPPDRELPIVLRGSKGPVTEREPAALYALGCRRGWDVLCARVASSGG